MSISEINEPDESQLYDFAKSFVESVLQESLEILTNPNNRNTSNDHEVSLEELNRSFEERSDSHEVSIDEDDDLELYFEDESFQ